MKELAKDFEATFLSLVLKEMRQTLEPDGGGLFAGDTGDVHGGLFDQFMAKHLADSGGVGMAASIEKQLRQTTGTTPAPTHAATTHHRPSAISGAPAGPSPAGGISARVGP